ncbi:MAG: hypothetical protein FD124_2266 [Alphaproteobacteria bacterium]|nr:MAG: hypothetical protein FD160_2730 [Caulobacteraceae bacterium]TPW05201.1 MAG: hypothetical protein FD124_2266 [Alphaproteobacteria bacterium]
MIEAAEAWLPEAALTDAAMTGELGGILRAWSAHWLRGGPIIDVSMRMDASETGARDRGLVYADDPEAVVLSTTPRGEVAIALAMLGLPLRWLRLKPADIGVLRAFTAAAMADLAVRLCPLISDRPLALSPYLEAPRLGPRPARVVCASMQWTGAPDALQLHMSRGCAAAARKRLCRDVRQGRPLESRSGAIARQVVKVGAYVGAGGAELAELCSLDVGDVLVLDRGVGAAFELTVDGARTDRPCAFGDVAPAGSSIAAANVRVA